MPVAFVNRGFTVSIIPNTTASPAYITGAGMSPLKQYVLASIDFRLALYNSAGSEHTVNGTSYPLELQFVHYDSNLGSFDEALNDTGSIVVVSSFFQIGPNANGQLTEILDFIGSGRMNNQSTVANIAAFSLGNLAGSLTTSSSFYSYVGSLTYPPCATGVNWVVMQSPMNISLAQLQQLRSIMRNTTMFDYLAPNDRPVQPIGQRNVSLFQPS